MADTAEELRKLSDQVTELRHQLEILTGRSERSEKFQEKMESNMWFVTGAKWFVGASIVAALGGLVSFVWTFATLNNNVNHHDKTLDNLDTSVRAVQKSNTDLTTLIIERFPSRMANAIVYEGIIVEITAKKLIVETDGKDRPIFKISRKTDFSREGKPIKATELKQGQRVRVLAGEGGHADTVEVLDK